MSKAQRESETIGQGIVVVMVVVVVLVIVVVMVVVAVDGYHDNDIYDDGNISVIYVWHYYYFTKLVC